MTRSYKHYNLMTMRVLNKIKQCRLAMNSTVMKNSEKCDAAPNMN